MAADATLIRGMNRAAAVRAFLESSPLTAKELQGRVGVSRPTVDETLSVLLEHAIVEEDGSPQAGQRSVGRPAKRYRLRVRARVAAGIDIGAHSVGCRLVDLSGTTIESTRRDVVPDLPATKRVDVALALLSECAERVGLRVDELAAVACGVVGASPEGDRVIDVLSRSAGRRLDVYSLPGFADIDLRAMLSERLQREVRVENDIQLAAAAEAWSGSARGHDHVVYMHAGNRLGSAMIIAGKHYRGVHGLAASIGVLPMLEWTDTLNHLRAWSTDSGSPSGATFEGAFLAAAAGDSGAAEAIDRVAEVLALGAAILTLSMDPSLVVVGGGMSRSGDLIMDPFRRYFADLSLTDILVARSEHGDDAVTVGASQLALNDVIATLTDSASW